MSTRRTRGLPARLDGVRRRFEGWRRTRKVRSRIPETLWTAAVKMAGTYGLHRTAKALSVNYYALKKRVQREAASPDYSWRRRIGLLMSWFGLGGRLGRGVDTVPPFPQVGRRPGVANFEFAGG